MGKIPEISHLQSFGAKCRYDLLKHKVKKLDTRSKEGIMIDYSAQNMGTKMWDLELQKQIVSRGIKYDETFCSFPSAKLSTNNGASNNVGSVRSKEEVDGNIDLPPEQVDSQSGVTDRNSYPIIESEVDNDSKFEDSTESPASATFYKPPAWAVPRFRRSARTCKPPGRYGLNLLSQALVGQKVPVSFKWATSSDNIDL